MLVADVPSAQTFTTCTGKKDPANIPVKDTSSPPMVVTRKFPAPPIYNTQPLLLVPPVIDGMFAESDGVTEAARPT